MQRVDGARDGNGAQVAHEHADTGAYAAKGANCSPIPTR